MTEGGHSSRDGGFSRMKSAGHELDAQRYRILKDYLLRNGFIHYVALSRKDSEPFVMEKAFYGQTFEDALAILDL